MTEVPISPLAPTDFGTRYDNMAITRIRVLFVNSFVIIP